MWGVGGLGEEGGFSAALSSGLLHMQVTPLYKTRNPEPVPWQMNR